MTSEVVRHLAPKLDGINIDLKSFRNDFYQKICKARLEPVLENIRLFQELGVLVEVRITSYNVCYTKLLRIRLKEC